jgi:cytoskeleton protein RodZ
MSTPGEKLRAAREARKLSIKQAVQATRIRSYYIEAMEADDLSIMPSAVQARGFLRAYAEFLGLDIEKLFEPTETSAARAQPEPEPEPEPAAEIVIEKEAEPEPEPLEIGEAVEQTEESQPSDIVFRQIGVSLRQRRELLGLTLDEIERHTRVRQANLLVIEQGDFESLPSPVQARGMLNTYANFLDMNGDAMLLRFADGLQARRAERQETPSPPRRRWSLPAWLRRLISADLVFGTLIIVSISVLLVWGASRIISAQETEEGSQGPSISDVLLASPEAQTETPESLPTSIEALGTFLPSLDEEPTLELEATAPLPGSILQVTLLVRERVFLRVIVDGEVQQDGRVAPGAALIFDGSERIEVLTGNGSAIQVIYNQFDFGQMGNPGEVVNRIYTLDGIQTPTPTVSPTPTNTPRIQPSATPTITGTPTLTEVP